MDHHTKKHPDAATLPVLLRGLLAPGRAGSGEAGSAALAAAAAPEGAAAAAGVGTGEEAGPGGLCGAGGAPQQQRERVNLKALKTGTGKKERQPSLTWAGEEGTCRWHCMREADGEAEAAALEETAAAAGA